MDKLLCNGVYTQDERVSSVIGPIPRQGCIIANDGGGGRQRDLR
jgi:hypothetical protein